MESVPFHVEEERRDLEDIGETKEAEEMGRRSDLLDELDRSSPGFELIPAMSAVNCQHKTTSSVNDAVYGISKIMRVQYNMPTLANRE